MTVKSKMIKDLLACVDVKKNLNLNYKKIFSYFREVQLIFLVFASAVLGIALNFLIGMNNANPFDRCGILFEWSVAVLAIYCIAVIMTVCALWARYDSEKIYLPALCTWILAWIAQVIGSRVFVYIVTCLIVCMDSFFISTDIFYYTQHTFLGSLLSIILLIIVNMYVIVYALLASSCALLIKAYEILLTQKFFQRITKHYQ